MRKVLVLALLLAPAALAAQTARPAVQLSLNEDGRYQSGDRARVRVEAAADGYLVVLRTDADGWIRVMYPLDPFDDHFVRGGREFEVRGRGDREAFQASSRGGSGVVLAAYSARPFNFSAFTRGDHWDYRVLDTLKSASDPEASLLAIVEQMADSGGVDYDVVTYTTGGNSRAPVYASNHYYSSYYYSPGWYRPYYSSWYYSPWYWRPYYSSYYGCDWCYPGAGWSISVGYGYRPWRGYRSYDPYYDGYWGYPRYGRSYGSYAFGYSWRSSYRFGYSGWNGNGWNGNGWNRNTIADGRLRNARTGEVPVRSRYTDDLVSRRRQEQVVTTEARPPVERRTIAGAGQADGGDRTTVARRTITDGPAAGSSRAVTRGDIGERVTMRRVIPEGRSSGFVRRDPVSGERSVTIRRDGPAGGMRASDGGERTFRRVDVPGRRAAEFRDVRGGERTFRRVDVPGRRAAEFRDVSGGERSYSGGRSFGGDRREIGGDRPVSRGAERSYDGGRVSPDGGGRMSSPGWSGGGGSRPSSDGGRASDGGGRRSPGGGGSGGGGSAPSGNGGGGGRRRG